MRLTNVIILMIIIGLFSSVFSEEYYALKNLDCRIEELRKKNDSLYFISESFYRTCEGRGFSSLEEWKRVCKGLWQLETIEWKNAAPDGKLIYGIWRGSVSEGQIYFYRKDE